MESAKPPEGIDRMSVIERWWRVTPDPNLNRKTTWTPEIPVLEASWVGAKVAGPFVLESHLEGAVDTALREIVDEARRQTPRLTGDRFALTVGLAVLEHLNHYGGQS
jgi:hypothetical protein